MKLWRNWYNKNANNTIIIIYEITFLNVTGSLKSSPLIAQASRHLIKSNSELIFEHVSWHKFPFVKLYFNNNNISPKILQNKIFLKVNFLPSTFPFSLK